MNRRLAKKEKELEWDKIVYKNLIEEIRISKEKIWKITYYTILIYAAILAIINISVDNKISQVFMYIIFLPIFLTGTLSFKIISRIIVTIINYREYIRYIQNKYKFIDHLLLIDNYPGIEDMAAIYFVLTISFYLTLGYTAFHYKLYFLQFLMILFLYLFIEIGLMIERRKFGKYYTSFDILINALILLGLILLFIITNFDIVKQIMGKFINII